MNKKFKSLVIEIVFLLVIMISVIPLFVYGSKDNSLTRAQLSGYDKGLDIEVVQKSDIKELYPMSDEDAINNLNGSVIKVTNLDNRDSNYDFIFKMNKIDDLQNYKIMFNGKIYSLNDLDYTEDEEYRYFTLDNIDISNKEKYLTFLLWITDEGNNYVSEDINYSFMMERNLYGV